MIEVLLYISADSRLWQRDAQPEQITVFVTFLGKPLKWWSSVALFMSYITSACFCMISQHYQVYSSTTEYQRASLTILPTGNYKLPFMGHKILYLSSLLVTCHQSSRLYGVDVYIWNNSLLNSFVYTIFFIKWLLYGNLELVGISL